MASLTDDKKPKTVTPIPPPSTSPLVNRLDETSHETFATGRPLEDEPDKLYCKHCKKAITRTAAKQHIAACLKVKKEKAQRKKEAREARERAKEAAREEEARKADEAGGGDGDEESDEEDGQAGKTTKKTGGKKTESSDLKGKKRKADAELEKGGNKKKKKDEPKAKVPKPKGPVDVERQCGVILPNGAPCARSLTCKSHSMGAKRAVPGRSLPYDMLLAAYQKKNQAKQQKAAIDANAPVEDEDEVNAGAVDSDEETAAVMSALAKWNPQPVVPPIVHQPIKRTYQLARLHEQLQTATNGGRLNIFRVVGYGAQTLPPGHPGHPGNMIQDSEDAPGELDTAVMGTGPFSRRSSSFSVSAGNTAVGGPGGALQRRPSVAGRA